MPMRFISLASSSTPWLCSNLDSGSSAKSYMQRYVAFGCTLVKPGVIITLQLGEWCHRPGPRKAIEVDGKPPAEHHSEIRQSTSCAPKSFEEWHVTCGPGCMPLHCGDARAKHRHLLSHSLLHHRYSVNSDADSSDIGIDDQDSWRVSWYSPRHMSGCVGCPLLEPTPLVCATSHLSIHPQRHRSRHDNGDRIRPPALQYRLQ